MMLLGGTLARKKRTRSNLVEAIETATGSEGHSGGECTDRANQESIGTNMDSSDWPSLKREVRVRVAILTIGATNKSLIQLFTRSVRISSVPTTASGETNGRIMNAA